MSIALKLICAIMIINAKYRALSIKKLYICFFNQVVLEKVADMQVENGKYVLSGGVDPESICKKYGGTTYVYDAAIMKRQFERITKAFSDVETLHISFACKALTNISVLRYFRSLGSHIDCVSLQEVKLALRAGFAPKTIIPNQY